MNDECQHDAYRMTSGWPDRETGEVGPYQFKCSACGEEWTRPAPKLQVEVEATVRMEARVSLVEYFNAFSERARRDYQQFEPDPDYEEWERPIAYLEQGDELMGGESLLPVPGPWEVGEPPITHEGTEFDESPRAKVRIREGKMAYHSEWTEEDFNLLCANVPWLDQFHRALADILANIDEEERLEDELRRPGPQDVPLKGL